MCVSFTPAFPIEKIKLLKDSAGEIKDYPAIAWPGYKAPSVRMKNGKKIIELMQFGLLPYWAQSTSFGKFTYNARSETVAEKPSYKKAWANGQFCLIPMQSFTEPKWEQGKARRMRIGKVDHSIFFCAAIWDHWFDKSTNLTLQSFSLLTINADNHPLMSQFHKSDEEKRSVVVIQDNLINEWLNANSLKATKFLLDLPQDFVELGPAVVDKKISLPTLF